MYKNKAKRIEEAKNNGTYDSPEPSPRAKNSARDRRREICCTARTEAST